ncbi:H-NS histone family protein [Xylophilus rhododendri]|uniref:H-NS histone family protein n=2 Tax=Xylophilus rhododendri TaxID=2697032 RepID=A0A857JDK8_9BURK|nr:H-NS histone family protein [Xylophilus rhododendri]
MKALKDLLAEKAALEAAISGAHQKASQEALAQVHQLIAEFGFTAQQVFPWKPQVKKVAAKYLDEKSGATWTGRGKPPAWIVGKDRDDFLIERPEPADRAPFLAEMAAAAANRHR